MDFGSVSFILLCQQFRELAMRININWNIGYTKSTFEEQLRWIIDLFISHEFHDRPQYHDKIHQLFLTCEYEMTK